MENTSTKPDGNITLNDTTYINGKKPRKRTPRWLKITVGVLIALFIIGTLADDPEDKTKKTTAAPQAQIPAPQPTPSIEKPSNAMVLAALDANDSKISKDDIRVKVINTYLDSLVLDYNVPADTISMYIIGMKSFLEKKDLKGAT